ncbi:MAG: hypothetical protein ACO3GK_05165 [Bacteroidia bacterium]
MNIESALAADIQAVLKDLYGLDQGPKLDQTRPEFEGDFTLVVFPYLRASRRGPEETAQQIGEALLERSSLIASFNVIKGFLNLVIQSGNWGAFLEQHWDQDRFGFGTPKTEKVMVEYASPVLAEFT